jgi:nickel-dependent lactate racemase
MGSIVRYGLSSSVDLSLSEGTLVAECSVPRGSAIDDPSAALATSLRHPLGYPPLAAATTPADRIVLAVEPGVPQVETIVAEVIRCLVEAGVDPDGVAVLRTATDGQISGDDLGRELAEDLKRRISVLTHNPNDRRSLAYLAANKNGDPILLNRAITDADVVVPIGRLGNPSSSGYHGVNGVVFPTFADHQAQMRFRATPVPEARKSHQERLIEECDEVGWLLGVTFAVEVVPGPGDQILHVLAGEAGAVRARGRELYEEAWRCSVPRKASLVVATIEGGSAQQTWQNVGTALEVAGNLVEDSGAIAVCCELAARPGPGIRRLLGAKSRKTALREIHRDRPEDVLSATQLAGALDRADVYLLSHLDAAMVEDLEMAPISKPAELVRLASRHSSCILLSNAPNAIVMMDSPVS